MAAAALPVACSGITISQQPLDQIHWKSTMTKLIVYSTIPSNFSVVASFFVGRGTILLCPSISAAEILIITITTSADSSE